LFLLRNIIVVIARFLGYCTFKIYSPIRLSSRKCVINLVFSVQCWSLRLIYVTHSASSYDETRRRATVGRQHVLLIAVEWVSVNRAELNLYDSVMSTLYCSSSQQRCSFNVQQRVFGKPSARVIRSNSFLQRVSIACYAQRSAVLAIIDSVRPSLRLSVRHSL